MKEGVTKQTESYEDEWPRGRRRGLTSNPMTRERSKVRHNVKERNNRRGMREKKQINTKKRGTVEGVELQVKENVKRKRKLFSKK
jgi:hypothetical protein